MAADAEHNEAFAQYAHPERLVGFHFFNPVAVMPLVEVVPGERTSEDTVQRAVALYRELGRAPVVLRKEIQGFVANRLQVAISREARRAPPAGSGCGRGAPKTASTASPSNLLTRPSFSSTAVTMTSKNRLSSSTTSVAGRWRASVVEPTTSTKSTPTTCSEPPSCTPRWSRWSRPTAGCVPPRRA